MSSTEKPLDAYLTTLISPAGTPDDHPDPPREVLDVMLAELVKRTQRFLRHPCCSQVTPAK
jgi:hypothetical protein